MTAAQETAWYEAIARRAENLLRLMKDPQGGCSTWAAAVAAEAQWLHDWWEGKFQGQEPC